MINRNVYFLHQAVYTGTDVFVFNSKQTEQILLNTEKYVYGQLVSLIKTQDFMYRPF